MEKLEIGLLRGKAIWHVAHRLLFIGFEMNCSEESFA